MHSAGLATTNVTARSASAPAAIRCRIWNRMGSGMMARLMFSARGTWMMTEMRPCWASCYI